MSDIDIERKRDALNAALTRHRDRWLPKVIGGQEITAKRMWVAGHTPQFIGSSLQVDLSRADCFRWYHHPTETGGDPLGLIAYVKHVSMKEAWKLALDFVDGDVPEITDAERRRYQEEKARSEREEAARKAKKAKQARHIVFYECRKKKAGVNDLLDTPVELYLAGRGINLRQLPRTLNSLYFHPRLYHHDVGRAFPAMVAAIVDRHGETVACHRTWLVQRRDGRWDRLRPELDGGEGKLTLGSYRDAGGCVRLWAGERVDPRTGEFVKGRSWAKAEPGSDITLVEGIENGLSIVVKRPERRLAVCIAVGGLASVWLPPSIGRVYLAGDNDAANSAAQRGFANAAQAHVAAGREVFDLRPPAAFKDWNDMLLGKRKTVAA